MKTNFFTSYAITACKTYFETLYFTPANCVLFRDCQEFSNLEPFMLHLNILSVFLHTNQRKNQENQHM